MTVPEQRLATEMMERRVPLHRRTGLTVVVDSERRRLDDRGEPRASVDQRGDPSTGRGAEPASRARADSEHRGRGRCRGWQFERSHGRGRTQGHADARIVKQPGRGKGDALRAGFSASRGDAIVMLDGDGSMSPSEIPDFLDALISGAEYAKGSRFLPQAGSDDINALRWVGAHGLRMIFNWLYGAATRISAMATLPSGAGRLTTSPSIGTGSRWKRFLPSGQRRPACVSARCPASSIREHTAQAISESFATD